MRPTNASDPFETRSRKSSISNASLASDRSSTSTAPATFFLSRGSDNAASTADHHEPSQAPVNPVSTLQETLTEAAWRSKQAAPGTLDSKQRQSSRRRSTIKPTSPGRSRRTSSTTGQQATQAPVNRTTTPSPLPSQNVSLPSSPTSSRSAHKSDEDAISDDAASQAIASSEDDQDVEPAAVQDSQPELIMPSIKMPSRRPFTDRGKKLGRFKILVAGHKGSGKTSLIKSIVQACEDIVHVDPLLPTSTSSKALSASIIASRYSPQPATTEIYASTRPYPSWWSDLEESRILRRRKSVGDSVLERNLCFVDTSSSTKLEHIVRYTEQQLALARNCMATVSHDSAGLLSGRGGSQVDVILYLVMKDHLKDDQEQIRRLSDLTNVIPLIARSDLLSLEEQRLLKQEVDAASSALPKLPATAPGDVESSLAATAPYTVTSINGPDLDTMDASLLMSAEYVQPLLPSELGVMIDQLFDFDTISYLKHTSAKKLLTWHASHPNLARSPSPSSPSVRNSTLASPLPTSLSNSGIFVPPGPASELSLTTSNSYALARVADHSQREERLAQIRLSKWASDLQLSLQRERERYERLARNERAVWLIERMGEEVRDGQVVPVDEKSASLVRRDVSPTQSFKAGPIYQHHLHDPLGLLQWQDAVRTRGWIALQVVGSCGVVGGLAFWIAKTWGLTSSLNDWAQQWGGSWFGVSD